MNVLHSVNQFMEKEAAGERLDVHHDILKRDASHVGERGCVRDPHTSQLTVKGRLARPSSRDFYCLKHRRGEEWLQRGFVARFDRRGFAAK